MESIKNFRELTDHLAVAGVRKRAAVVCGTDRSTQEAVLRGLREGFLDVIFVGGCGDIREAGALVPYARRVTYVEAATPDEAARAAVAIVREGGADILMKGLVGTDVLLRAVLDKETGILPPGRVLTHIAATELPAYPKLLFFTDPAVIPYPTQEQRMAQVGYAARLCRNFGIACPRISLVHCSEKVNARHFPHTEGYVDIIARAEAGGFGACIVDGPLDVKTSCCAESLQTKGIASSLGGEADVLVFPDIEAANVFYKTVTLFCGAETACALQGPLVPVVLPSRADTAASKFYSLALACLAG